jgi:hypothetical protein
MSSAMAQFAWRRTLLWAACLLPIAVLAQDVADDSPLERGVLEELYHDTGGDSWLNRAGWLDPSVSLCNWYGVNCTTTSDGVNVVQSIEIPANGLAGTVPTSVWLSLPSLKTVDLRYNKFLFVSFDFEVTSTSTEVSLQSLFLDGVQVPLLPYPNPSTVPRNDEMQNFTMSWKGLASAFGRSLQILHVREVGLTHVPESIVKLSSLIELDLSENRMGRNVFEGSTVTLSDGTDELTLGQHLLTNLQVFICSKCRLTGDFPTRVLGSFPRLKRLHLNGNAFYGSLVGANNTDISLSFWKSAKTLEYFDVSRSILFEEVEIDSEEAGIITAIRKDHNPHMNGPIPSFASFTAIQQVILRGHDFTGTIPSDFLRSAPATVFAKNGTLMPVVIDLASNRINGTIPIGLARFAKNSNFHIFLGDNFISSIPNELCSYPWNGHESSGSHHSVSGKVYNCDHLLCPFNTSNGNGRVVTAATEFTPKVTPVCTPCSTTDLDGDDVIALGYDFGKDKMGSRSCGRVDERRVLEQLYRDTDGDNWANNSGWYEQMHPNGTVPPHWCTWYGVSCYQAGRYRGWIASLHLGQNNLQGKFNSDPQYSVWNLAYLQDLDLQRNLVNVSSFEGIANAAHLRSVQLSDTSVESLQGLMSVSNTLTHLHLTGK